MARLVRHRQPKGPVTDMPSLKPPRHISTLHILVRLDPDIAAAWSDEEVVRRWGRLFPPRDKSRRPMPATKEWVQWRLSDAQ